jgi:membrane fusion protein (multidrug efflux system)
MSTSDLPMPSSSGAPARRDVRQAAYAPRPRTALSKFLRLLLVLILLALVVAGLGFLKYRQIKAMMAMAASGAFTPPATAVTTSIVHQAQWEPLLPAIGTLEAVQGTTVSADLAGIVTEIDFESGKNVKAGDILVRLVTDQEQATLDAALANRDLMVYSLRRAKELRDKNANSQSDYDTAEANERQAEANVSNAKAAIARKTIRAPFDGVLGIRKVSLGQYLHEGDPVVPLQALDPIYVDFTLPQQNMRDFSVGSEVHMRTDATGTEEFAGKITAINPLVDTATRNFQVQATISNKAGKLRPGMFANVDVLLNGRSAAVLPVVSSAIQYAPYGNSVFVVVKDMELPKDATVPNAPKDKPYLGVRQQFVHTGQTKGDFVAITSGLKEGDEVVTSGVFKLQNGSAVQINNSVKPEAETHPNPEES